jgi:hypothetical protein
MGPRSESHSRTWTLLSPLSLVLLALAATAKAQTKPGPADLQATVDSCFALAVPNLPASTPFAPRGLGQEDAVIEMLALCKGEAYRWLLACTQTGGTKDACIDAIKQRARAVFLKSGYPSTRPPSR